MEAKIQGIRTGEFLVSEANGTRSRETITATGGDYPAGQVLGIITASGKYTAYATGASDGSENAAAVLYASKDASTDDQLAVVIARDAEVSEELCEGIDAAAITALAAKGVITR